MAGIPRYSRRSSRIACAAMMSPAEILNAAEALPDDDKRREVAAELRHAADNDPELEPDERYDARECARRIEAMCCTTLTRKRVTWRPPEWKEFDADRQVESTLRRV